MAASLLKLGRLGSLKCIRQECWSSVRSPLTAALCTKAEKPKKPAKKTQSKAEAKAPTLEASDERAALLAYKTAVAFPTRLSTSGFVSKGVALGESETVVTAGASQVSAETPTKEEAADAGSIPDATTGQAETGLPSKAPAPGSPLASGTKTQEEQEASSSSSSSSESDSDSDSDDEKEDKPEKTEKTKKVGHPEGKAEPKAVGKESVSEKTTSESSPEGVVAGPVRVGKHSPEAAVKESLEKPQSVKEAPYEEVPSTSATSAAASAKKIDASSTTIAEASPEKALPKSPLPPAREELVDPALESPPEINTEVIPKASPNITAPLPEVGAKGIPDAQKETLVSAKEVASEVEAAPETVAEHAEAGTEPTEEVLDLAPVIGDSAEPRAETEVSAAAQEPAPEPEPEPFDNTTYKNLQHHSYNTYTFSDMDVEMAKHRLPQPSSGRPSPRH